MGVLKIVLAPKMLYTMKNLAHVEGGGLSYDDGRAPGDRPPLAPAATLTSLQNARREHMLMLLSNINNIPEVVSAFALGEICTAGEY